MRCGGLGIRSAVQLTRFAFLASAAAACSDLIDCIILSHLRGTHVPNLSYANALWSHGHDMSPPEVQRTWDSIKVLVTAESLLGECL